MRNPAPDRELESFMLSEERVEARPGIEPGYTDLQSGA